MLSPPPIRAMSTPALLALLLGEEAATRLSGRSLIEIFALHAGRTLLNEVHACYALEACKELMARALAETMRLGDCLSDLATVRDYLRLIAAGLQHEVFSRPCKSLEMQINRRFSQEIHPAKSLRN